MLDLSILYDILKNYTEYDIIVGGIGLQADINRGAIILTPLFSVPVTHSDRFLLLDSIQHKIQQLSLVKITIQCDFYRAINSSQSSHNVGTFNESEKIKEVLKSKECMKALSCQNIIIYPIIGVTTLLSELTEGKRLISRAYFTCELIYLNTLELQEDIIRNIELNLNKV